MRLIDAENTNFLDAIGRNAFRNRQDIIDLINNQPTIYAVPVVCGHWETNSDRPDSLICSVCKCGFDMWKHDPHNFCPNCGAENGWRLLRSVRMEDGFND
mgnify:CR=1 FL=1